MAPGMLVRGHSNSTAARLDSSSTTWGPPRRWFTSLVAVPLLLLLAVVAAPPAAAVDNVEVTLGLQSFEALDDPDPNFGDPGDFYAVISFANGDSVTTSEVSDNGPFEAPADWKLTTTVDRDARQSIDATVRVFDADSGVQDNQIDIDPEPASLPEDEHPDLSLDITIDPADGSWSGDTPTNVGTIEGDGDVGNFPTEGDTQSDGTRGRLDFSVGLGSSIDLDGDGIPNTVETLGIRNDDGSVHTDMAALGADPCRKTLAIEIDWLAVGSSINELRPKPGALQEVAAMFNDAPIPAETDDCPYEGFPEASSGVDLVIDLSSAIAWDDRSDPFGLNELAAQRGTNFDQQRAEYFFYNVWGFTHDGSSSSGVCCNGKGFMVTLGQWPDNGSVRQQAGTLAHELGHNLGLGHGGDDPVNYKPNYLSIMNYHYQTRGLVDYDAWSAAGTAGSDYVPNATIDYSRAPLPDLDEDDLDESAGVDGPNTAVYWRDPSGTLQVDDARGALDYDDDGDTADSGLQIDLNDVCVRDGDDGTLDSTPANDDVAVGGAEIRPGPDATCDTSTSGDDEQVTAPGVGRTTTLEGYDDWANIAFAGEINAGEAGHTGPLTDVDELTYEEHQRIVAQAAQAADDPPEADAGPDATVTEGSTVELDGSGSSDPEGEELTYEWTPTDDLDDATSATPDYTGVDDGQETLTLTVTDPAGQSDSDTVTVTTTNAPPQVQAGGAHIDEGQQATVSATFTDPGVQDTHTAVVDWGQGPEESVVVDQGAGSGSLEASHVYGDNGTFPVTITVTDDDGGVGEATVTVVVDNLAPTASVDDTDTVSFPGGEAVVTQQGTPTQHTAKATDAGSDDLTFAWDFGPTATYFNNGTSADPFPSPDGVFPFSATDEDVVATADQVGAQRLGLTVTDDDGGDTTDALSRLVTGTEDRDRGPGFWRTEYQQRGRTSFDEATLAAYLEIVRATSTVFDEDVALTSLDDAASVLSPRGDDERARARADLLVAWLHFASGAVDHDATVSLGPDEATYLDVMFEVEDVVGDPGSSDADLREAAQTAHQTRSAE